MSYRRMCYAVFLPAVLAAFVLGAMMHHWWAIHSPPALADPYLSDKVTEIQEGFYDGQCKRTGGNEWAYREQDGQPGLYQYAEGWTYAGKLPTEEGGLVVTEFCGRLDRLDRELTQSGFRIIPETFQLDAVGNVSDVVGRSARFEVVCGDKCTMKSLGHLPEVHASMLYVAEGAGQYYLSCDFVLDVKSGDCRSVYSASYDAVTGEGASKYPVEGVRIRPVLASVNPAKTRSSRSNEETP